MKMCVQTCRLKSDVGRSSTLANLRYPLRPKLAPAFIPGRFASRRHPSPCGFLTMQDWLAQTIAESASAGSQYTSTSTLDYSSGDGFGDPRFLPRSPALCLGEILTRMQVRADQYLAVIIMEYADKVRAVQAPLRMGARARAQRACTLRCAMHALVVRMGCAVAPHQGVATREALRTRQACPSLLSQE